MIHIIISYIEEDSLLLLLGLESVLCLCYVTATVSVSDLKFAAKSRDQDIKGTSKAKHPNIAHRF